VRLAVCPTVLRALTTAALLCGVATSAEAVDRMVIGRSTTAGVITDYVVPTPGFAPRSGLTAGPDGALWFTDFNGNKIGRITTAGVITEYPVPFSPGSIATGPDGALWFTGYYANRIGRITTAGAVTEYVLPNANSGPGAITAGPDGNLWFIELSAPARIGRITSAGVITEYPVPSAFGSDSGITTGPDGALWFTLTNVPGGGSIGRITTAGVVTQFALGGMPFGITAGPDGNLWFTESSTGVGKIGRITTVGVVTEYATPTAFSVPRQIAAGPDGALWFTESVARKVGRITVDGVVTEYAMPVVNFVGPDAIAAGPDGALWFTGGAFVNVAAVLPLSRSVQVGAAPATAFAAIVNTGQETAVNCAPAPPSNPPAGLGTFVYQTTDASNNLVGTPNTPANIPPFGALQHYVFGFSPTAPIAETSLAMQFLCDNTVAAPQTPGVNNFFIVADTSPVSDTIALIATISGDGVVRIPSPAGLQVFAIGSSNVGATGTIVVSGDTGGSGLPLTITVCETDAGGNCLAPPTPTVTVDYLNGTNRSFKFFAQASGSIPFDPANNRLFARLTQAGVLRGATSAAVCTTPNAGC
jgi:virginiamycin B lyase